MRSPRRSATGRPTVGPTLERSRASAVTLVRSVASLARSMVALGGSLAVATTALLLSAGLALAAEPSASPAALVMSGGDPRSEGSGPGLVGSPLLVLAGVVVLGVVTAIVTILVARLAERS